MCDECCDRTWPEGLFFFPQYLWYMKLRRKMNPAFLRIRVVREEQTLLSSPGVLKELTETDQPFFTQASFVDMIFSKNILNSHTNLLVYLSQWQVIWESQLREQRFILVYGFSLWLTSSTTTGLWQMRLLTSWQLGRGTKRAQFYPSKSCLQWPTSSTRPTS